MKGKRISCGLLGGQESDLYVLSELHKQESVRIAFLYDKNPRAVGLEIAEILGIERHSSVDDLSKVGAVDYVVVSEPRERMREEVDILVGAGAKVVSQNEALSILCRPEERPEPRKEQEGVHFYTIEDTLRELEKLFDRRELLKFLLEVAVESTDASAGSIMLYSPETEELTIAYATGLSERVIKGTRQKLGEGIAGTVAREKKAKLIRPTRPESLYLRERDRVDISSAISVPLIWENLLLGVLNVSSGAGEHELDESDFETLKRLSRRISRVLHESLKLREIQIRHREQSLRTTVGELEEKPISFREKFSVLSTFLAGLLGAEAAEVYLAMAGGDWFVLGGSNRRFPEQGEKVRSGKGTLSRCFLEQRPVVLTESQDGNEGALVQLSSLVFFPLSLSKPLGVLLLEFSEPHKLDEFWIAKDAIALEVSRFISSEMRELRLKRELEALNKVSETAPLLLTSQNLYDLCETLARSITDILECERTSVRIKARPEAGEMAKVLYQVPGSGRKAWEEEDERQFSLLLQRKAPYTKAFLKFEAQIRRETAPYYSLLAVPVLRDSESLGGIIAYDKRPSEPLEDPIFSDLDRTLVNNLLSLAIPLLEALAAGRAAEVGREEPSYESLLQENLKRLHGVCEQEIKRSDRYHHAFSLILFKIKMLDELFKKDYPLALRLVDEITRGLRTRTRKTDYHSWITRDSFALLSLEGSQRIRFLISRVMLYLTKDLSSVSEIGKESILVGRAGYPGESRSAEELLREAQADLSPYSRD